MVMEGTGPNERQENRTTHGTYLVGGARLLLVFCLRRGRGGPPSGSCRFLAGRCCPWNDGYMELWRAVLSSSGVWAVLGGFVTAVLAPWVTGRHELKRERSRLQAELEQRRDADAAARWDRKMSAYVSVVESSATLRAAVDAALFDVEFTANKLDYTDNMRDAHSKLAALESAIARAEILSTGKTASALAEFRSQCGGFMEAATGDANWVEFRAGFLAAQATAVDAMAAESRVSR